MSTPHYILIGSSNESAEPVIWQLALLTEDEVVARAEAECEITREDLEFFAGFELIGTSKRAGSIGATALTWSRDWMPGEKFKASLLKLSDDGRTFKAFNAALPEKIQEFLEQAATVGLRREAEALVACHTR